jgi:hypothetical protein
VSRHFRNRTARPIGNPKEFWPTTMNEAHLRAERSVMAQPSRSRVNERPNLTLVYGGGRRKRSRAIPLLPRVLTTVGALLLLTIVLKFLPPLAKPSDVQASRRTTPALASDLHLSGVQISRASDGRAVYLDGLVTNAGKGRVSQASADVGFHNAQGRLIALVRRPLVGMSHGGTDLVDNEFARNPIKPNEMRFFRVAVPVEEIPPTWNQEAPDLTIAQVGTR